MPTDLKDEAGQIVGFVCTRGACRQRCRWCTKPGGLLCDYKVAGKTCDAPMCPEHAKRVGPEIDWCPMHVQLDAKVKAERAAEQTS